MPSKRKLIWNVEKVQLLESLRMYERCHRAVTQRDIRAWSSTDAWAQPGREVCHTLGNAQMSTNTSATIHGLPGRHGDSSGSVSPSLKEECREESLSFKHVEEEQASSVKRYQRTAAVSAGCRRPWLLSRSRREEAKSFDYQSEAGSSHLNSGLSGAKTGFTRSENSTSVHFNAMKMLTLRLFCTSWSQSLKLNRANIQLQPDPWASR